MLAAGLAPAAVAAGAERSRDVKMFKWMADLKMPSLDRMHAEKKAKEKFGDRKLVVLTGTSSGLGRSAAKHLLRTGQYHVVGAVRDMEKMEAVAEIDEFDTELFTPMHVDLQSFESVRNFVKELNDWKGMKPIDRLICNAGIYQPSLPYAKWSEDGHEQTMQANYLSHFLLVSELMQDMVKAPDPRVIMIGSVTGNDNTVGGGGVYPIADLKELDGLRAGFENPVSMLDGYNFDGAKAYKDSKLCLMMTSNILHDKYHKQTGISFSSIYPGCLAESPLFREKREWFRRFFPIFMKYITGGFVSEDEAGQRLFQVAHDPRCAKSGVYWSWNGGPREGRGESALEQDGQIQGGGGAGGGWESIYENDQSDKVLDRDKAADLFKLTTLVTGADWPAANQPKSPCPTLKVVGGVTNYMNAKEEAKRMAERPGLGPKGVGRVVQAADAVLAGTVGRAAKVAKGALLGDLPEEATGGSRAAEKEDEGTDKPAKRGVIARLRRGPAAVAAWLGRRGRAKVEEAEGALPDGSAEAVLAALEAEEAESPDMHFLDAPSEAAGEAQRLQDRLATLEQRLGRLEAFSDPDRLDDARQSLEKCLNAESCDIEAEYEFLTAGMADKN